MSSCANFYNKWNNDQWKNKVVENIVPVSNSYVNFPAGTFFVVKRKFGGLELVSFPCKTCKATFSVTRCPASKLILANNQKLPEGFEE